MVIPDVGGVLHVSIYSLIESIVFNTDISDGVAKKSLATLLGEIVRLHQRTKIR